MIRINLIPYRAERRQLQILQHVVIALGSLGVIVFLTVVVHIFAAAILSGLQDEYADLSAQNKALQKKIGELKNLDKLRTDVQGKLNVVDRLQKGRFRSLITMHAIASVIPENVWLTKIEDKNGNMKLEGLGESNKAVADFLRALDESDKFEKVSLLVIERVVANNVPVRRFTLTMKRSDDGAKKEGAKAKAKGTKK